MSVGFKKAIKQELVAQLQVNPWLVANQHTGLGIQHAKTRTVALQLSEQHSKNLRRSAFIFGDTYKGQPIDKTKEILQDERFDYFPQDEENEMLLAHDSLGIVAKVKHDSDRRLVDILLLCDFTVDQSQIGPASLTGLGAQGEIIDSRFNCTIDATTSLVAKMFVLRHLATDGSVV